MSGRESPRASRGRMDSAIRDIEGMKTQASYAKEVMRLAKSVDDLVNPSRIAEGQLMGPSAAPFLASMQCYVSQMECLAYESRNSTNATYMEELSLSAKGILEFAIHATKAYDGMASMILALCDEFPDEGGKGASA